MGNVCQWKMCVAHTEARPLTLTSTGRLIVMCKTEEMYNSCLCEQQNRQTNMNLKITSKNLEEKKN